MSKLKLYAGILGILSVLTFAITAAISISGFKDGVFSPLYRFVTELGFYTKGTEAYPLIFNIGIFASGIMFCAFMVLLGILRDSSLHTAVSFSGVLSGMLLCAQGIFTLNYDCHNFILIDFLASAFITCMIFIVAEMLFNKNKIRFLNSFIAFLTGLACIISAGFVFASGTLQAFSEYTPGSNLSSFSVIGWISYVLFYLLIFTLSFEMFSDFEDDPGVLPAKESDDDFSPSKKSNLRDIRDIEL